MTPTRVIMSTYTEQIKEHHNKELLCRLDATSYMDMPLNVVQDVNKVVSPLYLYSSLTQLRELTHSFLTIQTFVHPSYFDANYGYVHIILWCAIDIKLVSYNMPHRCNWSTPVVVYIVCVCFTFNSVIVFILSPVFAILHLLFLYIGAC